jgi:hypothetical protein
MLFRADRWLAKEQKNQRQRPSPRRPQAAQDFAQLLDAEGKID